MLILIKNYLFPGIMCAFLALAILLILRNENRVSQFKEHSVEHSFVIDLNDSCGWQEFSAIQQSLESQTHQDVYGELLDDNNRIYRVTLKCPPRQAQSIWNWLSGRQWVERADRER